MLQRVVAAMRGAVAGSIADPDPRYTRWPQPKRSRASLAAQFTDPLVLVTDDAESLHGSVPALYIRDLLLVRSDCLRVAIASRRGPSLRAARGRYAALSRADLVLRAEEACELFELHTGRRLSSADWSS